MASQDFNDVFHDSLQSGAMVLLRVLGTAAGNEGNLCSNLVDIRDQCEPTLCGEIAVHCSDPTSEDAVHGHAQGSGFSIHCASATDHQVREPNQVEAVDDTVRH